MQSNTNPITSGFRQNWAPSFLALLLIAPVLAGCAASNPLPPTPPVGDGKGYLLQLPGIAGDVPIDHWWMAGLRDGGVIVDMEFYDWTKHQGFIGAIGSLQAYQHNQQEAQKIADRLDERIRADPDQPVLLTGESGGTGLALWALERLPPGVQVDCVLLMAPAVSPGYDMTRALRHVRGHLYVVTSPLDLYILGLGTTVFGTTDGLHGAAAGLTTFHAPPGADPVQYQKVVNLRWRPGWAVYGNLGNHSGAMSPFFARYVLAPVLCREIRQFYARLPDGTEPRRHG